MRALLTQMSNTDIRLLRVFKAVVDCGGLSAAELELNISCSTISRHLKDLEQRLSLTLCHRGRGGFALTQEGQEIYAASQRLLAALEGFSQQVNDLHKSLQGQLSIAVFDKMVTNPACHLPEAIAEFTKAAPDVSLDIQVVPVNEIEKGVIDGQYHIGIIVTHRMSESLAYQDLFGEQMKLYCGKNHPLFDVRGRPNRKQLLSQKYAGLSFHSPNMEMSLRLSLDKRATANDQEGIATLIRSGLYIGFLPDHYADSFVQQGQMSHLDDPEFEYQCQFAAIYRKSPAPNRLIRRFLSCLVAAHQKGDNVH